MSELRRWAEEIVSRIHDDVTLALGCPLGPEAEDALFDSVERELAEVAAGVWESVASLSASGTPPEGMVSIARRNAEALRALVARLDPK